MCWRQMRRRGEWRRNRWRILENRNWKIENGKRVAARRLVVPFFVFREEEKNSPQRTRRTQRKKGGRTEMLWRWIVRAHPYKPRVGHPQVHSFSGVTEIEEHRLKPVLLVFLVDV